MDIGRWRDGHCRRQQSRSFFFRVCFVFLSSAPPGRPPLVRAWVMMWPHMYSYECGGPSACLCAPFWVAPAPSYPPPPQRLTYTRTVQVCIRTPELFCKKQCTSRSEPRRFQVPRPPRAATAAAACCQSAGDARPGMGGQPRQRSALHAGVGGGGGGDPPLRAAAAGQTRGRDALIQKKGQHTPACRLLRRGRAARARSGPQQVPVSKNRVNR